LQPRENGQSKALRNKELRGLGSPRNEHRSKQDAGRGPERSERTEQVDRFGGKQQSKCDTESCEVCGRTRRQFTQTGSPARL
jgi:hypothetical protein